MIIRDRILLLILFFLVFSCEDTTEPEDCAGIAGGNAFIDFCGVCVSPVHNVAPSANFCGGGTLEKQETENGICGPVETCHPFCGGGPDMDECGVCYGDGIPGGVCDCFGNVLDCSNECGGTAELDVCGICGGDNSSCLISYAATIQPIFDAHCINCHGISGGSDLSSYSKLMEGGKSGAVVISGNGVGSLLIMKMRGTSVPSMPYANCCIDSELIDLIELWINQGAQDN